MTLREIQTRLALADARETKALRDMKIAQYRNDQTAYERAYTELQKAQDEIYVLEVAERTARYQEEEN